MSRLRPEPDHGAHCAPTDRPGDADGPAEPGGHADDLVDVWIALGRRIFGSPPFLDAANILIPATVVFSRTDC